MYKSRSHNLNNKSIKKLLLVAGCAVLLAGFLIFGYKAIQNEPENFVIPVTEKNASEAPTTNKGSEENSSSSAPNTSSDKAAPNSVEDGILKKPSGVFVSNHRPSLGNSPDLMVVQSVCSTTPGAACYIQFTKNGLIRKLPGQKVDSNGDAYWTWNVKDAQLSEGAWKITAIATLGSQTEEVNDPIPLEVQP